MLAVDVIVKQSSRIPTDREEEKDETKLSAIWERRVRIPAAWVTEQQMQRAVSAEPGRAGGSSLS